MGIIRLLMDGRSWDGQVLFEIIWKSIEQPPCRGCGLKVKIAGQAPVSQNRKC